MTGTGLRTLPPTLRPARTKPLRGLGIATTVLLGLCAAADVAALAAGVAYHRTLATLRQPFDWNASGLTSAEEWHQRAVSLQLIALLLTAVGFVVWFHRARRNAGVFVPDGHRLSPGWAIGAWVTPVVHLWFPKRIADDVWRASSGQRGHARWWVLDLWWALWLATFAGGLLADWLYNRAETPSAIQEAVVGWLLVDATDLVCAVLAIVVVRRISALQDARAALAGAAPRPAPRPTPR